MANGNAFACFLRSLLSAQSHVMPGRQRQAEQMQKWWWRWSSALWRQNRFYLRLVTVSLLSHCRVAKRFIFSYAIASEVVEGVRDDSALLLNLPTQAAGMSTALVCHSKPSNCLFSCACKYFLAVVGVYFAAVVVVRQLPSPLTFICATLWLCWHFSYTACHPPSVVVLSNIPRFRRQLFYNEDIYSKVIVQRKIFVHFLAYRKLYEINEAEGEMVNAEMLKFRNFQLVLAALLSFWRVFLAVWQIERVTA